MPRLVEGSLTRATGDAEETASQVKGSPSKRALAWLYVDDLEKAHEICQDDHSQLGSYIHAIVHRREGDPLNARYWAMKADRLPQLAERNFGKLFTKAAKSSGNDPSLVELQREEWRVLWDSVDDPD